MDHQNLQTILDNYPALSVPACVGLLELCRRMHRTITALRKALAEKELKHSEELKQLNEQRVQTACEVAQSVLKRLNRQ